MKTGTMDELSKYGQDAAKKFSKDLQGLMSTHVGLWASGESEQVGGEIIGGVIVGLSTATAQCAASYLAAESVTAQELQKILETNVGAIVESAEELAKILDERQR